MAKQLSEKQKKALRKGANLMYKAIQSQKKAGTKTVRFKAGGEWQSKKVYRLPLNKALKQAK